MAVCFSLSVAINATIVPLLIAIILGQLIHTHTINVGLLIFTAVFQFAFVAISWSLDKYGVAKLHLSVEYLLYEEPFNYLVHQDYSFFADRFGGSLVTQASRFAKAYTTFNDTVLFDMIPQVVATLMAVVIICFYNLYIGVTVFTVWLIAITMVVRFGLTRLPLRRSAVAKESEQVGELADVISNAITVKTFGAEDREKRRYQVINLDRSRYFLRSWHRAVRNVWAVEVVCAILQMIILVGGILAIRNGSIGFATFLLFQVYIMRIIENIRRSSMIVRQMEVVAGDAQEMTELLEQPPLIQDSPDAKHVDIKSGVIEFKNMSFQYDSKRITNKSLFRDFNLRVEAGQKVGLVGPSGGGKTTLTRLLLRFLDILEGSITIDGISISDIPQQDLRRSIAYVPQEPLLFHRSIKDNIRYGKPEATDEEIISVSKKAYAHEFIKELKDGYDTLVGERGVKLSGGQRQRVAIARAMLTDAPILVLDEATSALDSESEKTIQKALWSLMKDKTTVVIAHRLSTIQRLDRIVVIERGDIKEDGSHSALLKNKGLYSRLWSHQSGGFLEEQDS
jgi:ATP-binding cassette subfamily B protein